MDFYQLKGNTWVLSGQAMIPVYRLDPWDCILLDSGSLEERAELMETLERERLRPVGILGSHTHIDHMGNHAFLKQVYGARIALSAGEARRMDSLDGVLLQYPALSPQEAADFPELTTAPCPTDEIIPSSDIRYSFCGAEFRILPTPGHSPGHLCIRTTDDVLYLGDSLVTPKVRSRTKLLFAGDVNAYLSSLKRLEDQNAALCLAAHRGVVEDLSAAAREEASWVRTRMEEFRDLAERADGTEDFTRLLCQSCGMGDISRRYFAYLETVAQAYMDYMQDLKE